MFVNNYRQIVWRLRCTIDEWTDKISLNNDEINEERSKSSATSTLVSAAALLTSQKVKHDSNCEKAKSSISWYAYRFSDYKTILSLVFYIKRFISNSQSKNDLCVRGELTVVELKLSEVILLRIV